MLVMYFVRAAVVCTTLITLPASADAPLNGITLAHNDTQWISIGGGLRLQTASRNSDVDDSSEFSINSYRFYVSGQLHKYLKFLI